MARTNSRLDIKEENISELEAITIETNQSETQREKKNGKKKWMVYQ